MRVASVPELGQIVDVRGSRWVVSDVRVQGLLRSPADEGDGDVASTPEHAVSLQSIEEDCFGDRLEIVWELECGKRALPANSLPRHIDPDHLDNPNTLAAFVDALRWGAISSADSRAFQAPLRSGAEIRAWQLEPLRRAIAAPRVNLLLADDVGLGKTIEAGLIVQELLLRHRARSVIIVCPAGLMQKWRDEMREKFGLDFTIVNRAAMGDIRRRLGPQANPFLAYPRVIVSMSWISSSRAQRLLRGAYAAADEAGPAAGEAPRFAFDALVVDEAHHLAPAAPSGTGQGRYSVDTHRTRAVRELARHSENRLFLTATPHNGYTESFTALLEMVDPDRFARGADLDETSLHHTVVRRLKSSLPANEGFKRRELRTLSFEPTKGEERAYVELLATLARIRRAHRADDQTNEAAADLGTLLLKKRFLSSPPAFARTIRTMADTAEQRMTTTLPDYDEVLGDGADDDEEGRPQQPEMDALGSAVRRLPVAISNQRDALERLATWGEGFEGHADARLEALIRFLDGVIRPGGHWNNERVVVFTEYADTLRWMREVLYEHGYTDDRLSVIHGGTDTEERERIRLQFNAPPSEEPVRVLLATDAAGEGIDLQRYCHRLVQFDVPFNPNRIEQRIGRIDRFGQRETPIIWHLVPIPDDSELSRDRDLLGRIVQKMARIREDLGSANPVVAPDLERELLGRSPRHRSASDRGERAMQRVLQGESEVRRQLTKVAAQLKRTRESMHVRPDNLRRVVDAALSLDHQPMLELASDERFDEGILWKVPEDLSGSWRLTTSDLSDPLRPDVRRPITFDADAARGVTDVVPVHLGHPLVELAARRLRGELWSVGGGGSRVHRATAVVVDGLRESFVATVARMVVVGASGVQLHEEVFLAGTRLRRRQTIGEELSEQLLAGALDGQNLKMPSPQTLQDIAARWNAPEDDLQKRVNDAVRSRGKRRWAEILAGLEQRERQDERRIDETFDRFGRTLRTSLSRMRDEAAKAEQTLFDFPEEERQRRRDVESAQARLEALPRECEAEIRRVRERYRSPQRIELPAAVVFAITPEDAREGLR